MALRWIEGFETFDTTLTNNIDAYLNFKYANAISCTLRAGRIGGYSMRCQNVLQWQSFAPLSTWIIGFGYKKDNSFTEGVVAFMDGGTNQFDIRVDGSGLLYATQNGNFIAGSNGTTTLLNGVWYYIEVKGTINTTTGSVEVMVNGVQDINVTNVNTQTTGNAASNNFRFFPLSSYCEYDDVYICDTTGAVNNDFLGDNRVEAIMPTGAGANTDWTPLTPPNFSEVNEIPPDGDTSYVSSNTPGNVDTYAFGNLTGITTGIKGLQVNILNRKDDAGSREIAPVVRSGGTDYTGNTFAVLDNYSTAVQVYEEDPDTSAAWLVAGVNAAEFGQEVIS